MPDLSAPSPPSATTHLPPDLSAIIESVDREASTWQRQLSVSIGQARELTGLKDSQIRYYEDLEALRPRKTSAQSGATRLYSLADLRRLRVLALLVEQGRRPAEAAELVRSFSHAITVGAHPPISQLVQQERGAVADGFLLARLISQVLEAAQAELTPNEMAAPTIRVRGAILPLHALFSSNTPCPEEVASVGGDLLEAPTDMLVALVQRSDPKRLEQIPAALFDTGNDAQTILFYSPDPHPLGAEPHVVCCAYIPLAAPEHTVMLLLESQADVQAPTLLQPADKTRAWTLDTLLGLCVELSGAFCKATLSKGYRYRSDGFPIALTRESSASILSTIQRAIFPTDAEALAVLLVPNNLDKPASLSILAHSGYDDALALRAKLDLRGDSPQGISGRAYLLREPFLSLHAEADSRIEYALEEGCRQALAVPLATTWATAPFGVLYLATRGAVDSLDSQRAYMAIILGGILGELLGRWWLTRLRKDVDATVHRRLHSIVGWLDSLDERGPDFERGLQAISALWQEANQVADAPALARRHLTLAVLDIDHYRHTVQSRTNEPLPLHAQRHVNEAIKRVDPELRGYWFKNDHALLIVPGVSDELAHDLLWRVADQVALTPLQLPGQNGPLRSITVSVAYKELTYKALHDLGRQGEEQLHRQIGVIVRELCARTRLDGAGKLVALGARRRDELSLLNG